MKKKSELLNFVLQLFRSQQYCLSCRAWDSSCDPLGHKVALAVIVSQFSFQAYCLSLGYLSSNSRRKKPYADSITLQEMSARQPVSVLRLYLVQRTQTRLEANRFSDKGKYCSVSQDIIYSKSKRMFLWAALQHLPQLPLPNSPVTLLLLPSIFWLWVPLGLCGSWQPGVRYFLSSFQMPKVIAFVSLRYSFCYSNVQILIYKKGI